MTGDRLCQNLRHYQVVGPAARLAAPFGLPQENERSRGGMIDRPWIASKPPLERRIELAEIMKETKKPSGPRKTEGFAESAGKSCNVFKMPVQRFPIGLVGSIGGMSIEHGGYVFHQSNLYIKLLRDKISIFSTKLLKMKYNTLKEQCIESIVRACFQKFEL